MQLPFHCPWGFHLLLDFFRSEGPPKGGGTHLKVHGTLWLMLNGAFPTKFAYVGPVTPVIST